LIGIAAVVQKFEYFALLVEKCLFIPLLVYFVVKMGKAKTFCNFIPLGFLFIPITRNNIVEIKSHKISFVV